MAIKQLTLNQTVKLIKEIAESHNQINTVYFGDVWEFLAQPDNTYPAMFYSLTGSNISGKNLAMNFSFFFLDRQLQSELNETDVLSDQLLIAQDVFAMISYPKFDWDIDQDVTIEFFTEKEEDYLAGVKFDITLNYPMVNDRCQVPSSFSYPDYIASISESGGAVNYVKFLIDYPSFETLPAIGDPGKIYVTNDTNKLYRWVDTAWVQIYPSLNWGDITGTLSAQTDLQNALNAKAPLASPTFTGTVSGITKSMVGLANVDNTTDANKPISSATQTALNAKYDASNPSGYISSITSSNVTTALGYTPENSLNKGVANGYASLDGSGLVPSTQLPSYVDDVLEYTNLASFPGTGTTGKIYVDLATNKIYRWSGSTYIEVSPTVGTTWGGISGTLSNQTDLQSALNAKQATLTAGTGINITSNTIASTITQYADSNARASISLTTNGTSGAATYNSTTGVLNIPSYAGGGGGGSGTVTSVGMSVPTGFSISGTPITDSGTLALVFASGYSLPSNATQAIWSGKQDALSGTGFVKSTAGVISYDTNTYLTGITSGQVTTALGFTPYNATNPSGYISANQSITLSGDITGTGTTAITTALATITQASSGSFIKVTLDTKGRVTGNTAVGSSDITTALGFTPYNATNPNGYTSNVGTVTSVSALTIGTSGTDIASSVATGTTTPVITLNIPTASATNRGALSSSDWSTFNGKQGALTLTTTGTSGAATLVGNTLNIPQYNGGSSFNGILAAGTATVSPLDFTTSGAVLKTSSVAGDMEVDANGLLYYSHADVSEGVVHTEQFISLTGTYTLTSQTAAQKLFNSTTNGAITVKSSTSYYFECFYTLSSMSGTSGSFGFALGGTATLTSIGWTSQAIKATTQTTAATLQTTYNTTAANTTIVTASTQTGGYAKITGIIRVNAAGTIIPQVSLGIAAAAIVGVNSYFKLIPLGTNTITSVGNWS